MDKEGQIASTLSCDHFNIGCTPCAECVVLDELDGIREPQRNACKHQGADHSLPKYPEEGDPGLVASGGQPVLDAPFSGSAKEKDVRVHTYA